MYCINLDPMENKAWLPVRKKGTPGFENVDAESEQGKKWIHRMIGKRVMVVFIGSDRKLFEMVVSSELTYESISVELRKVLRNNFLAIVSD